jgi:N utilization substance protein B
MGSTKKNSARSTSVARLAAAQGLYEMEITNARPESILDDFFFDRWKNKNLSSDSEEKNLELVIPDKKKFIQIIKGVCENHQQIDEILTKALSDRHVLQKLDVLLRTILRAATFEMVFLTSIPVGVVINEYVDLAHAFYFENEPSLVNGVLDQIAKVDRQRNLLN